MDLLQFLHRKREHSRRVFGDQSAQGVIDHLKKEVEEIAKDPRDLKEWVDVILLGLEGAWRATGAEPEEIVVAIETKQTCNENRVWNHTGDPDKAIEHVRSGDSQ